MSRRPALAFDRVNQPKERRASRGRIRQRRPLSNPTRADRRPATRHEHPRHWNRRHLVWTAYLELREATARRWKVAVLAPHKLAADQIVTSRKLERDEDREAAIRDLIERCRRGDFDEHAGAEA